MTTVGTQPPCDSAPLVIVSGGEGGIGRAICSYLLRAGYSVLSVDKIPPAGRSAGAWDYLEVDLADPRDILHVSEAITHRGSLTGLVHCAGVLRAADVGRWDEEVARLIFDVNVFAVGRLIASTLPFFKEGGAIVNISSIGWRLADQGALLLYGASKAALESFTRHCATQLGPRRIRVNALAPGFIDVAMSDDMRRIAFSEHSPLRRCALARMGTPEEVAHCVRFLLEASYVNGTTLVVDGGLSG